MAVIKCSNCENEILDTEIVCPYCDCPISETIKKMRKTELESYSASSIDGLTSKIPCVAPETEPEIASSADFEKEKEAILSTIAKNEETETDAAENSDESVFDDSSDAKGIPEESKDTPKTENEEKADLGKTVKFSKDMTFEKDKTADDTAKHPVPPEKTDKKQKDKNKNSKKTTTKKTGGKYAILGITLAGILVIIYLIWIIAGSITSGINKNKKTNKTVTIVESDATKTQEAGYEVHSSTLTIIDDSIMTDYDSSQDTPWYEYKDKIKHVTFGKNVTKIGAHSFEGFDKITDINISNSVITIGESAFTGCTSLTKITNMSKNIVEIGDYAFTGCKSLSKIPSYTEEGDFEPTVEKIGVEAFKGCKELGAFRIPMYTKIGTDAFFGHGNNFVIICESSSEAYNYATAKGIPTKSAFDSEIASVTEPVTVPSQTTTSAPAQSQPATQQPQQSAPTQEQQNTQQAPEQQTPAVENPPAQAPSLSDLTEQLGKAQTQEEKDRILAEIDKITG